jgi:hypothetical protein
VNRTDTSLRSAASDGVATTSDVAAVGSNAEPHSPQKRSSGSFAAPQLAQAMASGEPQLEQNFLPERFCVPQTLQVTWIPPCPGRVLLRQTGQKATARVAQTAFARL